MRHPPKMNTLRFSLFDFLLLSGSKFLAIRAEGAEKIRFNRDIRPILSDHCFACHGFDKNKRDSGLRLDIREEALRPWRTQKSHREGQESVVQEILGGHPGVHHVPRFGFEEGGSFKNSPLDFANGSPRAPPPELCMAQKHCHRNGLLSLAARTSGINICATEAKLDVIGRPNKQC